MPEGDSIHRIAALLAPRLTGRRLERVTTQGLVRAAAGRTVTRVSAHGKHLVIELDNGDYLRAHLGMNGRFRAYDRAAGEAMLARLSPGRASLALVTADGVYVWIGAPQIEVAQRRDPRRGMAVGTLGPDVLAADFDPWSAAERAAQHGERRIADVLLDQRVVAGIGNIYKCESLFIAGVDPRTPVARIDRKTLEAIYAAAHRLMAASVESRRSLVGTPGRDHAVYGRTGKPCQRCGSTIACYSLGEPPRWTWSCPVCQPATEMSRR
ncbi:MAG TPA: DNA-formamidopyrimidine glycosylase family protein [Kofleriaceae bacterium]|jgi:endonuclease-8|nr:DNA-formamidopyrimidine glycosylase family protein [Kofleriaceae bacterium]